MRFSVWPMAMTSMARPILPWSPPRGECCCVPSQCVRATAADSAVSRNSHHRVRVTGLFAFLNLPNQSPHARLSEMCHKARPTKPRAKAMCSHTKAGLRLPVTSNWMLEARTSGAMTSNIRLHSFSLWAFFIMIGLKVFYANVRKSSECFGRFPRILPGNLLVI